MRTRTKVVLAAVVVVLVAAAGGAWWFLRDDAPPEVSLESAVESVESDAPVDADEPAADGVEGTWSVVVPDTQVDPTDDAPEGTFAGFRIDEELSNIGETTAVGRTSNVDGEITIEGTELTAATFEVDLTTIVTEQSNRDSRVQDALETDRFPTATFTLGEPIELGEGAATGEPVSVTAVGDLTVHGVTQPVELAVEAQLVGATVVVTASTQLVFADYGVEVPSAPIVVSADDNGILEVQLLFTQA